MQTLPTQMDTTHRTPQEMPPMPKTIQTRKGIIMDLQQTADLLINITKITILGTVAVFVLYSIIKALT